MNQSQAQLADLANAIQLKHPETGRAFTQTEIQSLMEQLLAEKNRKGVQRFAQIVINPTRTDC